MLGRYELLGLTPRLNREEGVAIDIPPLVQDIVGTFKSSLTYIGIFLHRGKRIAT